MRLFRERRRWAKTIRASNRVKASVKEKSDAELLVHYDLAAGDMLTNLGVLLIGSRSDRAKLGTSPIVQAIRYDEREQKIRKDVRDDDTLSPIELVDAVRRGVPDFEESHELPDGLLRISVPAYDENVVRALLINALVHRPYTQRGDILLSLYPDRLEIVNIGPLPLGITPDNILHRSRRRNDGLACVFHDLRLMKKEGSGFDMMYERLLASGRSVPVVTEYVDLTRVVVQRRIVHPGVIRLLAEADRRYGPSSTPGWTTTSRNTGIASVREGQHPGKEEAARSCQTLWRLAHRQVHRRSASLPERWNRSARRSGAVPRTADG